MTRLSPQDLDRLENERLDTEEHVYFGFRNPSPSQGRKHSNPEVPPLRNARHGPQPLLEDLELERWDSQ